MTGEVPVSQMGFCGEPTADADAAAGYLRTWYEANRETWWERWRRRSDLADNLMLGLMNEAYRIDREKHRQLDALPPRDDAYN